MSTRTVKKWVSKQIDKATENEKSKLAKVKELLKETEVILFNSAGRDLEDVLLDVSTRVKLASSWIGE